MPRSTPKSFLRRKPKSKLPEVLSKLPKVGADRTRGLDFLFGALKAAPYEASAYMSRRGSGRVDVDLQPHRGAVDAARQARNGCPEVEVALKLLDAVFKLRPDYVEAWNWARRCIT